MKKLTTEEWILKAKLVHGDKYDYSKVLYINSRTKILIICLKHGSFWQLANAHLLGLKCPYCSRLEIQSKLSLGTENFIKRAKEIYKDEHNYSKVNYVNNNTKVCVIYSNGEEILISPKKYLNNKCETNNKTSRKSNIKYTTEYFIKRAKQIHGDKYDYSKLEYTGSENKVCIICPIHGEFYLIANNHLHGSGCLKCKHNYVANLLRMTKDEFIEKSNKIHCNLYLYNKVQFINNKTKVIITCKKHGDWLLTPHDHLSGYGCPKCKISKQLYRLYYNLTLQFSNEKILYEVGKDIVRWLDNQRFDIYFPKYNIAIEYNGELHYIPVERFGGLIGFEQTILRDELKRKKCKENNCTLFEIKYDYTEEDFNNLINNITNIINNYETTT